MKSEKAKEIIENHEFKTVLISAELAAVELAEQEMKEKAILRHRNLCIYKDEKICYISYGHPSVCDGDCGYMLSFINQLNN